MEHVIVERVFAEPQSIEKVEAQLRAGQPCLATYRVKHLRTSMSLDGRRMICEYEAPDAQSVRMASEVVGLPYERVWTAHVIVSGR
ncbi:MAG TPA: nickel-binding protein [Polyangiales bacterium]|nr:nickel-binding protein [Polyangiales bacterium]